MTKKRIYELAKELKMSSKQVIKIAKEQGLTVGNHMSTVNAGEEQVIKKAMKGNSTSQ